MEKKILFAGLTAATALLLCFVKLAEGLLHDKLAQFDQAVTAFITGFITPQMTLIMKILTMLGATPCYLLVALGIVLYLVLGKKKSFTALMVAVNLLGAWLLNVALKNLFHRVRPELNRLIEVGGYSFPSGHAMISFAFYGFLAYLVMVNLPRGWGKYLLTIILALLPLGIGISRIYLGVHYPSDVVAGYAVGGFWLLSCIFILEAVFKQKCRRL